MEQLLIRDLPTGTKQALKNLAAHKGTSMEAEARAILRSALNAKSRSICEALAQKNQIFRKILSLIPDATV